MENSRQLLLLPNKIDQCAPQTPVAQLSANRPQRRDAVHEHLYLPIHLLIVKPSIRNETRMIRRLPLRIWRGQRQSIHLAAKQLACLYQHQCMSQARLLSLLVRYNSPTKFRWQWGRGWSWYNYSARRSRCMWLIQQYQCQWRYEDREQRRDITLVAALRKRNAICPLSDGIGDRIDEVGGG